jgi:hypothetical protein
MWRVLTRTGFVADALGSQLGDNPGCYTRATKNRKYAKMTRVVDAYPGDKKRRPKRAQVPLGPSKRERQERFRAQCKAEGLTAQESMVRASVFPIVPPDKIRILFCPEF